MNKMESLAFSDADTILDTDPAVSMDINIRKSLQPGDVIEVDYLALRQVLEATGAPEDRGDSTFVIDKPLNFLQKTYKPLGWHSPERKDTHVRLTRNTDKLQKIIQHELRHYGDLQENPRDKAEILRTIIGNYANRGIAFATWPSLTTSGATIIDQQLPAHELVTTGFLEDQTYTAIIEQVQNVNLATSAVLLGSLALSAKFYWRSDRERIARQAEKLDLPQVISIRNTSPA